MPKESLNIYLTAVDKMSPALASITDKTKALDKESQQLQHTYESLQRAQKALIDRKVDLEGKLKAVNEAVKEARKNFKLYGDEASSDAYKKAQQEQQKLRDEIAATSKALTENRKIYKENIETIRKDSLSGSGGLGEQMGAVLGKLGIGQQLSQLAQQAGEVVLGSAFGDELGSALGTALSGAISGAALGSAIAPGVGTAVGAALGGATGILSGGLQAAQARDDAFKDYYGGLYQEASALSDSTVESGSTIAGGREQTRMALAHRFGGEEEADVYLRKVEKMAAETNYDYDEIVGYTKLLLNSYDPDEVFGVLRDLSDATAGLDLNSSDVNMMIAGLSRMRTTGKATQEYLNYFRERGVDADQALTDYYKRQGKSVEKSEISGMVTKGSIKGEDAAEAILAYIQDSFGGLSNDLAGTYDAMVDNLGDITASLQARGGDAYNTLRKEGIQAEMDALSGELGEDMGEVYAIIGKNRARKENLEAQYLMETRDAVLSGKHGELWGDIDEKSQGELDDMHTEFLSWKAKLAESEAAGDEKGAALASANIEALFEGAEVMGKALFDNSEFMQALHDTEMDELQAILDNTAGLTEATKAAYELAQQLSKGRASAWVNPISFASEEEGGAKPITTFADAMAMRGAPAMLPTRSHAYGLDRVPYDDYPALLHEGERVLTAREAREQDRAEEKTLAESGPRLGVTPRHRPLGDDTPLEKGALETEEERYPSLRMSPGSAEPVSPDGPPAADAAGGLHITITGNDFVGTGEEMADQIMEVLIRKVEQAYTAAGR